MLVVYLAGAVRQRQAESTWQEEHFAEERRGSNFNVNSLRTSSESAIFPRLFLVCSQVRSVSIAREVKSSDQIAAKRLFFLACSCGLARAHSKARQIQTGGLFSVRPRDGAKIALFPTTHRRRSERETIHTYRPFSADGMVWHRLQLHSKYLPNNKKQMWGLLVGDTG